jgi:hypothetical protein
MIMSKTVCPGQDTAFWRPGDVFEVPCSECGYELEFFKDDASRRCRNCGQLVRNPKLNLGCAQWCEHAKECLGYDPKEVMAQAEAGESSLVDRLVEVLKRQLQKGGSQLPHALAVLEKAKEVMAAEGGQPRVIMTAALLRKLRPSDADAVMKEIGLDAQTRDLVLEIIADHQGEAKTGSLESKVVWDGHWLVRLSQNAARMDKEKLEKMAGQVLRTQSAKDLARKGLLNT